MAIKDQKILCVAAPCDPDEKKAKIQDFACKLLENGGPADLSAGPASHSDPCGSLIFAHC